MTAALAPPLLLALCLMACHGSTADSGAASALVELRGDCPAEQRLGGFVVEMSAEGSGVQGAVADGVVPSTVLLPVQSEGDCQLLARADPDCDPDCASDELCTLEQACVPYPRSQDLGTVQVDGLSADVAMQPVQPGNSYYDTSLPHPAAAVGAAVSLTAGGWVGEVQLHGVGGASLDAVEPLTVHSGQDLALSWQPPAQDTPTAVRLDLRIDQHGDSPLRIRCDFEDDGEGIVPAELVDALVDSGVTGFPSASLRRRTADHATLDTGCMDLEVAWVLPVDVQVEGYTPCTSDLDCPDGQECDLQLQSCL